MSSPRLYRQTVTVGMRAEHLMVDPDGDTHTVEMTESLGGVSFVYLSGETGERIVIEERGDERSVTARASASQSTKPHLPFRREDRKAYPRIQV